MTITHFKSVHPKHGFIESSVGHPANQWIALRRKLKPAQFLVIKKRMPLAAPYPEYQITVHNWVDSDGIDVGGFEIESADIYVVSP